MDVAKKKQIDAIVGWKLNLTATRIFEILKQWLATSIQSIDNDKPQKKNYPIPRLRAKSKAALNQRYISDMSISFIYGSMKGGELAERRLRSQQPNYMNLSAQLFGRNRECGSNRRISMWQKPPSCIIAI